MACLFIVYDNGSSLPQFPLGTACLASAARKRGYVRVLDMSVERTSDLSLADEINRNDYEIVGLGFIGGYWQYQQARRISRVVNSSPRRGKFRYVLGGHGPAADPEWALNTFGADAVVVGDGEDYVASGPVRTGIVQCGRAECRSPAYEMFNLDVYKRCPFPGSSGRFTMPVYSSKGCPHKCNFCYRMTDGISFRDAGDVARDIELLREQKIDYFWFYDELFAVNRGRVSEVCKMLKGFPGIGFGCQARVDVVARDPGIVDLLKDAGCSFINYGVEAYDDGVLQAMGKKTTCAMVDRAVEYTSKQGIGMGLNIIWGNKGDSIQTLLKGEWFLDRWDDHAQLRTIRPVTPYPGTDLFGEFVDMGVIRDTADFYDRAHKNSDLFCEGTASLMGMPDKEAHEALLVVNERRLKEHSRAVLEFNLARARELYLHGDDSFRGWRHT